MSSVTTKQLAKFAVSALDKGESVNKVSQKLASLLITERRSREVASLMRAIEKELAKRGHQQVTVTSATPVSAALKNHLAKALNAKNLTFHEVIDPSVVGGVKAQMLDRQLDLTVRAKLNQFKTQLSKG